MHLPDNAFRFPKRTNKGTEYMSISEVQAMFLGLQEKRRKLDPLQLELDFMEARVATLRPSNSMERKQTTFGVLDLSVLLPAMADVYVRTTATTAAGSSSAAKAMRRPRAELSA